MRAISLKHFAKYTGPQKEAVVELYKRRLSLTRCKYQEAGTNLKCPFGSNCFYSHE